MAQETETLRTTDEPTFSASMTWRRAKSHFFVVLGLLSVLLGVITLLVLLVDVIVQSTGWLDWQFFTSFDSRFPERAGIKAALFGTLYMMAFTMLLAVPIGVMSAIYLEEYAGDNWFTQFIQVNIANLAGVPSIVYGLLGLQVFVRWMEMGRSVLAGSCTMALLILPIIIVASREAIRAVPPSMREASFALGASKWETVRHHVLPYALPGMLTGAILAAARAIGETAPLITIGALTFVPFLPEHPLDRFTVLPIQIFNWVSRAQSEFHDLAAAGIIVLLVVLIALNSAAIYLRQRLRTRY